MSTTETQTTLVPALAVDSNTTSLPTTHPNPSLQVTADHNVLMKDAPVHAPGPGEVLLHIKATGICGYERRPTMRKSDGQGTMLTAKRSDIHFWKTGRIGTLVVEGNCILGHEAAGVVLQCGEGVTNLQIG